MGENQQSAERARKEERSETIKQFIAVRTVKKIEASRWNTSFLIGQTKLTLSSYFQGLIKHDIHHMKQIKETLSPERE
ncbi:hypothetical protein M3580_19220 [Bacillus safensis]|uniref:hypothetical protein n=1 Tax=Bacillus safensis TaxID=561879 RepID=UPI00203CCDBA|nr:hypothetical protein [Bacillus safensis]MCM2991320.1 hypothetical protein [Bacillus safensis]